ncbi:MAG: group II intron reverse transcriptase/maturase [Planctomycetaceae bacterium]
MKEPGRDQPPAAVPPKANQAGQVRDRWSWTEPSVWTDRMLTALENGVKGGVWFSLIDKVYSPRNLRSAFEKVKANRGAAGVDHQTIEVFAEQLEANLGRLEEELRTGRYRPQAVRRTYIPKSGGKELRPLGIPTVRDRVAQAAVRQVLEPIFEREFAAHSYGFRPGRSCKDALRRVSGLLEAGYVWVVDADLKSYFDSIPHKRLMERVKTRVADSRVLGLVESYLRQQVMETARWWTPEEGTPQGAVVSPLLSNIYLDGLDHAMACAGYEMVRYADDFVILCRSEQEARQALEHVRQWTHEAGLTLHPDKTRIVDASQKGGFDFLGYHFERGYRWPSDKSLRKLRDTLRPKTGRNNGQSLNAIIANVNGTLRGWLEYFKHSHYTALRNVDRWVRMRLRSIQRRRHGLRGRGRGADHQRWPNAYFETRGLLSLLTAQGILRQSPRG